MNDEIPQVWIGNNNRTVVIEDAEGGSIEFPISELRDLGRTLIALADEAGE